MHVSGATTLLLATAAAAASATFELLTPPARPVDASTMHTGPCGGQRLGPRTSFPLVGGEIRWRLLVANRYVRTQIAVTSGDAPPTAADFAANKLGPLVGSEAAAPLVVGTKPDLRAVSGAVDGANATLQFAVGDIGLNNAEYVCADIVLVGDKASSTVGTSTSATTEEATTSATSTTAATTAANTAVTTTVTTTATTAATATESASTGTATTAYQVESTTTTGKSISTNESGTTICATTSAQKASTQANNLYASNAEGAATMIGAAMILLSASLFI